MKKIVFMILFSLCFFSVFAESKDMPVDTGDEFLIANNRTLEIETAILTEVMKIDNLEFMFEIACKKADGTYVYLKYHVKNGDFAPFLIVDSSSENKDLVYSRISKNRKNGISFYIDNEY